jgi:hypothetical protein
MQESDDAHEFEHLDAGESKLSDELSNKRSFPGCDYLLFPSYRMFRKNSYFTVVAHVV